MKPINFPEANGSFGPPAGLDEAHVKTVPACVSQIRKGVFDGSQVVVVAWKPDEEDMKRLQEGSPVYLTMISAIVPHYLTTVFPLEGKG